MGLLHITALFLFLRNMYTRAVHVCVLTPARRTIIARHTVTRQAGHFVVSMHGLLSEGKVHRHAEYFTASSSGAAEVVNALLFGGNRTEDEAMVSAAHVHGRWQEARESPPLSLSLLDAEFVDAFTLEAKEGANRNGTIDPASGLLRQYLAKAGISVRRIVHDRSVKLLEKANKEGSLLYRRNASSSLSSVTFVECASRTSAYSAAWLARRELLLGVDMGARSTLEWHSHNLFIKVFYQSRKPTEGMFGYSFKTSDVTDFFVNHLSHVSCYIFFCSMRQPLVPSFYIFSFLLRFEVGPQAHRERNQDDGLCGR